MSSVDQVENTGNQAITNYDVSKIFIGNNRYVQGQYNNSGYDTVELPAGRLMGRVAETGLLVPHDSTADDGSQWPVGILTKTISVEEGDTKDINICIGGDVAEEKVILADDDTMDTVVEGRIIRDHIAGSTLGIKLVAGTELTGYDNQ